MKNELGARLCSYQICVLFCALNENFNAQNNPVKYQENIVFRYIVQGGPKKVYDVL